MRYINKWHNNNPHFEINIELNYSAIFYLNTLKIKYINSPNLTSPCPLRRRGKVGRQNKFRN